MEHLRPCPFCGGRAEIFYAAESGAFDVQCQQCGAMPYTICWRDARGQGIGKDEARDILARRWNGDAFGRDEWRVI